VTERQFSLFLRATGRRDARGGESAEETAGDDRGDRPAVRLNLDEARAFAAWSGKSLPTEAQWEKAARASDGRLYPWGNDKPQWDRPRAPRQIDPVCSFARDLSPYGAFDMSGNAWEWTDDWFEARAYQGRRAQAPVDPSGPAKPAGRIPEVCVRGGSAQWDVPWRSGMRPEARLPYLGFRGVLVVENSTRTGPRERPEQPPPAGADPQKKVNVIPF
jgi:formylglycine-generating enzyme required for sulfatase activity